MIWGIGLVLLGVCLAALSDWIEEHTGGPPRFWWKCLVVAIVAAGVLRATLIAR